MKKKKDLYRKHRRFIRTWHANVIQYPLAGDGLFGITPGSYELWKGNTVSAQQMTEEAFYEALRRAGER